MLNMTFEQPFKDIPAGADPDKEQTTCGLHCAFEEQALSTGIETPEQKEAVAVMVASSALAAASVEGTITL